MSNTTQTLTSDEKAEAAARLLKPELFRASGTPQVDDVMDEDQEDSS